MTESAATVRIIDDPSTPDREYLPGMGKSWLMPLYDPLTRLVGARRYRAELIKRAEISPGQSVLDVGCGSADLLMQLAAAVPGADLTGLDPDGVALGRAARKATAAGIGVTLIRGYADALPLEDASVDHLLSSLAIHHLDDAGRTAFAAEAHRVLRPGGKITILDFGGTQGDHEGGHGGGHGHQHGVGGHLAGIVDRFVRKSPQVRPNLDEGLPKLLRDAGFADAAEIAHRQSFVGPLMIVRGTRS